MANPGIRCRRHRSLQPVVERKRHHWTTPVNRRIPEGCQSVPGVYPPLCHAFNLKTAIRNHQMPEASKPLVERSDTTGPRPQTNASRKAVAGDRHFRMSAYEHARLRTDAATPHSCLTILKEQSVRAHPSFCCPSGPVCGCIRLLLCLKLLRWRHSPPRRLRAP